MKLDYDGLCKEVLVSLRAQHSQQWLSRKLGYSFNKVYRWESGEDEFYWSDFVAYCESLKKPLDIVFEKVFRFRNVSTHLSQFLEGLFSDRSANLVAKQLGESRYKVQRWMTGESKIPLRSFFQTLDDFTPNLTTFVFSLFPEAHFLTLKKRKIEEDVAERLALDYPYFESILRAVEILGPKKGQAVAEIEALTSVKGKIVEHILDRFEKLGIVSFDEKKLRVHHKRVVFTSQRIAAIRLNSFWLQRIENYLSTLSQDSNHVKCLNWAHRTLALNEEQKEKVVSAMRKFYDTVDSIVANEKDVPGTEVYVLGSQLFNCKANSSPDEKQASQVRDRNTKK